MIPVDSEGRVLVMHRSDKVRSAKNVWSFPSGMHEIDESIATTIERELKEEYGLNALYAQHIGVYENIGGDLEVDEQYHWVINVFAVRVADVTRAINREPDKHDEMVFHSLLKLGDPKFYETYKFHYSYGMWAAANLELIVNTLCQTMRYDLR